MAIPIEFDKRYKVNNEFIAKIRAMREQDMPYHAIARQVGLSYHTVYYWCCDGYREYKRRKNAQRKHKAGERDNRNVMEYDKEKRHNIWEARFKHRVDSYLHDKREQWKDTKILYGMPIKKALELYNKLKCKTNRKVKW